MKPTLRICTTLIEIYSTLILVSSIPKKLLSKCTFIRLVNDCHIEGELCSANCKYAAILNVQEELWLAYDNIL